MAETDQPIEPEVVDEPQALVPTQGAAPPAVVDTSPNGLLALAIATPDFDVEKFARLLELQREQRKEDARRAFFGAMSRFQAIVPPITKGKQVDYKAGGGRVSYKHATLDAIAEAIREPMQQCGLSYRFETERAERGLTVTCIVTHRDGHSEQTTMSAPADDSGSKNMIQQLGSTMTYMRRYTLEGALGLTTTEDDDGRGAPDPPSPLDDAELPAATEQTGEAASIRGPYGGRIRAVRDERAEGAMTRRECLVEGWPDNHVLITKSSFSKYKPGKNEWKNAGAGRPFTCDVTDGKNVKGEVWFLAEHLRHPAATGAIDVPGFEWEGDTEPRLFKPEDADASEVTDEKALCAEAVSFSKRVITMHGRDGEYELRVKAIGTMSDGDAPKSLYTASAEELTAYNAAAATLLAEGE